LRNRSPSPWAWWRRSGQSAGAAEDSPEYDYKVTDYLPESASDDSRQLLLRTVIRRFHREVGSSLAAIGLQIEIVRTRDDVPPEILRELDDVARDLETVVDAVRISLKELKLLEDQLRPPDSELR
jgi:hypothetical protein